MNENQRMEEIAEILAQALGIPVKDRSAFLDEACRNDPGKRAEVDSLLASYDDAVAFFDSFGGVMPALPQGGFFYRRAGISQ